MMDSDGTISTYTPSRKEMLDNDDDGYMTMPSIQSVEAKIDATVCDMREHSIEPNDTDKNIPVTEMLHLAQKLSDQALLLE